MPPATGLAALALLLASGANRAVFLILNHAGHPLGQLFWLHLTMLGDGAVALALVLPCIRRAPHCFWAALAAAVFAALWTQVTKQFIDIPRPLAALPPDQFFQAGPAYRAVSFPSGHAAAAFAMAGIWIMGVSGNESNSGSKSGSASGLVRALILLLATLVSLSRIMVGVHWPIDILWGMLGGWLGAWLGLALHARRRWRTSSVGGLLAGVVLSGVAASLLVSRHIHIPAVMPVQRLIGCVCLLWGAREIAAMLPPQWWRAQWWRILRRRAQWRRTRLRRPRVRQDAKGRADG
jgi:membrane-associated phospholipid phosphatase